MASPRIQVVIDATAGGLKKGVEQAQNSLKELGAKVDGMGKNGGPTSFFNRLGGAARGAAENGLGPLGEAASGLGVEMGGLGGPEMAAAAGMAALATAAVASIKQFEDLADRVRKFATTTGVTAEEASRLIANMDDLGISSDTGATAIARLARNLDAGKLDEYGIAVVRTKDGTVDMAGTLGNVADALAGTADPAKRATMGNDLLGRSYTELLPLLQMGSAGMADFAASVDDAQVLQDKDLAAAKELKIQMDNLKESGTNLGLVFAKDVVPTFALMATHLAKVADVTSKATGTSMGLFDAIAGGVPVIGPVWNLYAQSAHKAHKETQGLETETEKLTRLHDEAAAKAKEEADAERQLAKDMKLATDVAKIQRDVLGGLKKAQGDLIDTALSFDEVQMNAWESQQDLTAAFDDLANGTGDYTERLVKAEKAVKPYIDKQWELYKTQKELNGVALDAGDKADFYNRKLADLIGITGDPNLNGRLMDLARLIAGVSGETEGAAAAFANWIRQISAVGLQDLVGAYAEAGAPVPDSLQKIIDAANGVKPPGRAVGGNVSAGQPTVVGEAGPELFVPQSNGRILTAEDLARVGGGGGRSVVINVHSPIGRPDDVVRWIREEIRRLDRSAR